jgi:lipopolysaccharide export LptBFGC system permease protein LptF
MYSRPDFINMTVCIVALYMMFNTERISKTKFKMLVFGIIISLLYDIVWFIMAHSEYANE